MKRNILLSRLEDSIHIIGKGTHEIQINKMDYSPAQNHVLMLIGSHGDIGIKKLSQMLRVTSGAATQHVAALEKANLVVRKINIGDRREVNVSITKKGATAYKALCLVKSRILRDVFSVLDDKELQTLVNLFEKVSHKYINNEEHEHAKI
jgi:DNA-binding MarR family transcriptional regulator